MNKKKKIILIIGVLSLFAAQIAYSYNDKLIKDRLENELQGKNKEIILLRAEKKQMLPFMWYAQTEKEMIDLIKGTDQYKKDSENLPSNTSIKFNNEGFATDGIWYFGLIDYISVHKNTGTYFLPKGESIPIIIQGYQYILKYRYDGKREVLAISRVTDPKEWNENLNKLPESILPDNAKYIYSLPIEN